MKLGGRKRCGKCRSCGKTKKRFSHSALDLRSTLPTTPAATGPSSNTTFLLLPGDGGHGRGGRHGDDAGDLAASGGEHRRGGVRDEPRRSRRTSGSCGSGRSGGGQGLSQQRYAGGAEGSGSTGVYLGTGSRTAAMERQAGSTGGSVLESAADSGRARETFVAAARRVAGTQLRPRLRDGRDAARVLARTKQCSQASADSSGSAHPVAGDAETGG